MGKRGGRAIFLGGGGQWWGRLISEQLRPHGGCLVGLGPALVEVGELVGAAPAELLEELVESHHVVLPRNRDTETASHAMPCEPRRTGPARVLFGGFRLRPQKKPGTKARCLPFLSGRIRQKSKSLLFTTEMVQTQQAYSPGTQEVRRN